MPNQMHAASVEDDEGESIWLTLPDSVLLFIFQCLPPHELTKTMEVGKFVHFSSRIAPNHVFILLFIAIDNLKHNSVKTCQKEVYPRFYVIYISDVFGFRSVRNGTESQVMNSYGKICFILRGR